MPAVPTPVAAAQAVSKSETVPAASNADEAAEEDEKLGDEEEADEFEYVDYELPIDELGTLLAGADTRDELVAVAGTWLLRFFEQAIFMSVKGRQLIGYHGSGRDLDAAKAKSIKIDTQAEEVLGLAIARAEIHFGRAADESSTKLLETLGDDKNDVFAALPVTMKGKTIGVFCAVRPTSPDVVEDKDEWGEAAAQVAAAQHP